MDPITELKLNSPQYPPLLKEIPDSPKQLFARGNLDLLQNPNTLAVVGTRKCTSYGLAVTEKLVEQAASVGIIIISGLARGIDAAAHKATLKAGGRTIAVLGGGIDDRSIYPSEHKNLAKQIIEAGGLVVSEYEPGTTPFKSNFVARNRIVAALSKAILVVEAPEKSGALITANFALDYNKEVLAIPGPITSTTSQGPNKLISEGAKIVTNIQDIFDIYEVLPLPAKTKIENYNSEQTRIIHLLSQSPLSISELIEQINMEVSVITRNLTELELMDKVVSNIEGKYSVK